MLSYVRMGIAVNVPVIPLVAVVPKVRFAIVANLPIPVVNVSVIPPVVMSFLVPVRSVMTILPVLPVVR